MISITRNLAHQLQTVFRRALNLPTRGPGTPVAFQTGSDGLRVRARTHDAAVEYHLPGSRDNDEIVAPLGLLNDCKGTKHDEVQLETTGGGEVIAAWTDSIPQVVQHDPPSHHDSVKFPSVPEEMKQNSSGLLLALHHAMETADTESTRYAINNVQLDGNQGRIVATDGGHILAQDGFDFPWDEQVLIPRRTVFGSKELPSNEPVSIGKSEDYVTIRVGPWTFHLLIEKEGRYPAVEDLIRRPTDALAKLCMSNSDAGFLTKALKRLPAADEYNLPVTVDLNGAVVIRAHSDENQSPTEVLLSSSTASGEAIRINTNRHYLGRALKMGFREVSLYGVEAPAICHDGSRHYVWALLGKDGIIKPSENAVRIESSSVNCEQATSTTSKEKTTTMPQNRIKQQDNGQSNGNHKQNGTAETLSVDALIEQAETVKTALRESAQGVGELIASLKRHRRRSKTLQSALSSIRQLQALDA